MHQFLFDKRTKQLSNALTLASIQGGIQETLGARSRFRF